MEFKLIGIIAIMTLVTYGSRAIPLLAFRNKNLRGFLKYFIELIPVALLAALILPELVMPGGDLSLFNPYLLTGVLTFIFARLVPNLLLGILFGMGVFWGINALF